MLGYSQERIPMHECNQTSKQACTGGDTPVYESTRKRKVYLEDSMNVWPNNTPGAMPTSQGLRVAVEPLVGVRLCYSMTKSKGLQQRAPLWAARNLLPNPSLPRNRYRDNRFHEDYGVMPSRPGSSTVYNQPPTHCHKAWFGGHSTSTRRAETPP